MVFWLVFSLINIPSIIQCVGQENQGDEIDQENPYYDTGMGLIKGPMFAQSFKPSLGGTDKCMLSRVEVMFTKTLGYSSIINVQICYDHQNKFFNKVLREKIGFRPQGVPRPENWFVIDFDDLPIIPEDDYYLVLMGYGDQYNHYTWFFGGNEYDRGMQWRDLGDGWQYYSTMDFAFRTYRTSHPVEPELSVNPDEISFGELKEGEKRTGSFKVENTVPGSTLFWKVKSKPSWVTTIRNTDDNLPYGEVLGGKEQTVEFVIDTYGLGQGPRSGDIKLTAGKHGGGDASVKITFTVKKNLVGCTEGTQITMVTIARSKSSVYNLNLFDLFFDRFPNVFQILRSILGI